METQAAEPLLYSRRLAATALSISVRAVDYLLAAGEIKTVPIGSKRLIPRAELLKLARTGRAGGLAVEAAAS